MKRALLLALGILCLALAACVPAAQDTRPQIAVINAPAELREPGLAERFVAYLGRQPEAAAFGFSSRSALRYQESYRDLGGSRAPLQAAFIARSQGAAYAVMVGYLPSLDLADYGYRQGVLTVKVAVAGQLQAVVVEPESAEVAQRFTSGLRATYVERRTEFSLPEGVSPESDEGRRLLREAALKVRDEIVLDAKEGTFDSALPTLAQQVAGFLAARLAA